MSSISENFRWDSDPVFSMVRTMSKHRFSSIGLVFLVWLCFTGMAAQGLTLPRVFSDNMVLQREIPVKIWGWAEPGSEVAVAFGTQTKTAKTGPDGKWTATLDPLGAQAEPGELAVNSGGKKVTIKNVLVGEVWICSGQSNMEWTINQSGNARENVENANYPLIRHFKVQRAVHHQPQTDVKGEWAVGSPATAASFTAVGYHFALELHKKLHVPVGLLNTSWGGTRIEPWTDPEAFSRFSKLEEISHFIGNADATHREAQSAQLDLIEAWVQQSREALQQKRELPEFPGALPAHPLARHDRPTGIYNAMVAPLIPYGIRGAIWYQGESNNGEGMLYHEKMKALLSSWRTLWGQGDFPFYYVQLASYRYNRPEALPGLWEAQTASLSIPNTGMAVITDISDLNDIHPRNKEEVGRRLSLWALAKQYGMDGLEYSGPLYKSKTVAGNKIILAFDHAAGLKSNDGNALTWFAIAGEDKQFVEAKAEISGNTVIVSGDSIDKPVAVRFGWNELAEPNLVNGAGLPASPFRTDF
jgi:sialate O-acetylesterase